MGDRKRVEDGLEQIASLFGLSGKDGWKAAAYERGAEVVRALGDDQLEAMISADGLRDIDGIGPSLAKQISALWRDGRSELLDRLEAQYPRGAAELARVPGMTVRRIRALADALGIGSIAELRDACEAHRVRAVRGFGVKLEQKLGAACEQINTPPVHRRMLLVDAIATANRLRQHLASIAGVAEEVELAGAARRGEESVDDLELLVVTRDPEGVWAALARLGAVFALDRAQSAARLSAGIGLRLTVVPPERAGAGLLTATGPRAHVEALEQRARARGVALPDVIADVPGAFAAEAAIYRALDLAVTPPELRVDGGEAELSERNESRFAALVEAEHIRGLVHCHTEYSDGRDSVEAMARAAEALGMEYITITDHSPSAHYAGGLPLDRLKQQWDEIARVQEQVNVRILRGTESDILVDGNLDYPDSILERFDVVIASIHSRFKLDPEAMTKRLVRAMELPIFKIWGHALGRLLLSREPIRCDVPRVLDALAASRGAVEINADPHRLDLAPEWIPHARERGIRFVISVDAHSTRGLSVLPLGVTMARRGHVERSEVLNTLPPAAFADQVRPI
jgi:DNA polymerase (family 10)